MKITQQLDVHPDNCDCGLCEPVPPAQWTTFAEMVVEMVLWTLGLAVVVGILFVHFAVR
jgi:ABC-type polysaccharide/polyol phosphate export permease